MERLRQIGYRTASRGRILIVVTRRAGIAKGKRRTLLCDVGQLRMGREGTGCHMYIAIDSVGLGLNRELIMIQA